jgi:prepilin-type N-terminal cleavage/methylation domain-containing protein
MQTARSFSPGIKAFSLIEVMIVASISGLVLAGLMGFFIQGLNVYHFDSAKLMVNRDIRKFTSEMTDNATYSNYFMIFNSFSERSALDINGNAVDTAVDDGKSGDMLVLVFKDPEDDSKVNRVIGYYRDAVGEEEGPVRKFDLKINPSSSTPVFQLLPATSTMSTNPEVIELAKGLSENRLFYNLFGRSVIVKGQIIHRGGLKGTRYERATNTYNFTIHPRG